MGEGVIRDPQLAQTGTGSAATAPSVTHPLTHLCLLQHHEQPQATGHGLEYPSKIPQSPPKGVPPPPSTSSTSHGQTRACFPLPPPSCVSPGAPAFPLLCAASHHLSLTLGDVCELHFSLCCCKAVPSSRTAPCSRTPCVGSPRGPRSLHSVPVPVLAQQQSQGAAEGSPRLRGFGEWMLVVRPRRDIAVAGGDIEPSPAGGVHSSETASAGKTGPARVEPPEHLPRLGTRQQPWLVIRYPELEGTRKDHQLRVRCEG